MTSLYASQSAPPGGTRDLTAYYAAPPRSPLPRPDVTAAIYLQSYVPRVGIVLPDRPATPAELEPAVEVFRPPFGEPGEHRRPVDQRLRAAVVVALMIAFVAATGVFG